MLAHVFALLTLAHAALALAQPEAGSPEDGPIAEAVETDAGPTAETTERQLGFDPALVGLPGFPVQMSAPQDFDHALELIEGREAGFRAQIKKLTRAGDLAEAALFRARRRLLNASGGEDSEALRELVQAREQELATARSGVDYAREALLLAGTARTLLERRYDVLRGVAEDEWSRWLNETTMLLRKVADEKDFAITNLGALRAIELALGRRLAAPDLDEDVRRALVQRVDALERHEELAEALINAQDQVRSLAERLRLELEPRVRERPLEQRMLEAQDRLTAWWNSELFVFQDQGVYARDLVKGMGVFILVLTGVSLIKLLLRRTVLPRLAGNLDKEQRTYRALALAVIRKTSLPFVVILAFYEAISMAIVLDKPFRVGDFINTGDTLGVVEHIGVKTTQIRSLSGEQIVLSNTDLLNSCIHNYKRMRERRVVFKIGVVYETPAETLERIPSIIEEIVSAQPHARFDRAHFFEYGDFALVFEIVYYVHGADYGRYMDIHQNVNLGIYRRFHEQAIGFAYPTQELIVRRPPRAAGSAPEAAS